MTEGRQATPGAARTCPHCRQKILASAAVCPACRKHLRFEAKPASARSAATLVPFRVEGKITRHVIGVGVLRERDVRTFAVVIEVTVGR